MTFIFLNWWQDLSKFHVFFLCNYLAQNTNILFYRLLVLKMQCSVRSKPVHMTFERLHVCIQGSPQPWPFSQPLPIAPNLTFHTRNPRQNLVIHSDFFLGFPIIWLFTQNILASLNLTSKMVAKDLLLLYWSTNNWSVAYFADQPCVQTIQLAINALHAFELGSVYCRFVCNQCTWWYVSEPRGGIILKDYVENVLIHIHVSAAYSWLQIYLGWQYHFDCICGRRNEEVTRHPKTREQKYHPAIVQPETRIYVSNIWYMFKKYCPTFVQAEMV